MSSNDIVLSVKNLSKRFEIYDRPRHRLLQMLAMGKKTFYNEFWALQNIDFEIRKGESIGIVGRNGAGKSTLLQIITGVLTPTTGCAEVKGRVAALLELGSGFNPDFSGRDNVYMNASVLGMSKVETDAKYDEILEFADIGDFIEQPVKTYSSGMMLRLAFAVQVMVEPDILIIDEAMAVGDALFQKKCFTKMMGLKKNGTSLIIVSHDVFTIKQFCERAILLDHGEMLIFDDSLTVTAEYYKLLFPQVPQKIVESSPSLDSLPHDKNNDKKLTAKHDENFQYYYPERPSWGCGGAILKSVKLYGYEQEGIFDGGDILTFELDYKLDPECVKKISNKEELADRYIFGIRVDTNKANVVSDLVSVFQNEKLTRIDVINTTNVKIEIKVTMPHLAAGNYFFTPGVAYGSEAKLTPLVSYENLIMLGCVPKEPFIGMFKFNYEIRRI